MKFVPALAPVKVAVLPLVKNKEIITGKAREVFNLLKKKYTTEYDEGGSIGKRYRRQDEIGTPYCVTIDFDTVEKDDSVTIRDRDTTNQERVKVDKLVEYFSSKL
jgi:glycyl-tRNA synthetase